MLNRQESTVFFYDRLYPNHSIDSITFREFWFFEKIFVGKRNNLFSGFHFTGAFIFII